MRATVVVLPVPGPPATTVKRRITAVAAATACRSTAPGSGGGNSRASPAASTARSTAGSSVEPRPTRSATSARSWRQ